MTNVKGAPFLKRIGAGIFDSVITFILAAALITLFNSALGYDELFLKYQENVENVESQYNVSLDIPTKLYEEFSEEETENYNKAYETLIQNPLIINSYSKLFNITVLSVTLSLLATFIITDCVLPVLLKDGRTIGKKLFGICVVSKNMERVTDTQIVIRALLGKFAIESMIPAYIIIMLMFNQVTVINLLLFGVLFLAQVYLYFGHNKRFIHDLVSRTQVIDSSLLDNLE